MSLLLRGGEALYGDDTVVAAIAPQGGSGCEPLKVCNSITGVVNGYKNLHTLDVRWPKDLAL